MLEISEIPLFSQLSPSDQQAVGRAVKTVDFATGAALCRKGDPGRNLFTIVSGGVKVMFSSDRGVFLGPGQIIGELSVLSGMPVSASVYAARPTRAFVLDKDAFLRLLDSSPLLHRTLAELLVDRLRQAPMERSSEGPSCAMLVSPDGASDAYALTRTLFRRITLCCPDALYCELREPEDVVRAREKARSEPSPPPFDCPPEAYARLSEKDKGGPTKYLLDRSRISAGDLLARWRSTGVTGQYLILAVPSADASGLKPALRAHDAVVALLTPDADHPLGTIGEGCTFGEADVCEVRLHFGNRAPVNSGGSRWSLGLKLPATGVLETDDVGGVLAKELDMLARWSVNKGIGIAMGAGAARGFAHLGVLKVLEEAGIPLDYFSGTSIGGIIALIYTFAGSADEAINISRQWLGAKTKVLDRMKSFRAGLYSGARIKSAATEVFRDIRIEDLNRPVSAVAADLITGEKVVMDSGSAVDAALATSAIPGFFPPVARGRQVLIDGAPVSRVPVDLLDRHRCRMKMAINVAPRPNRDEAAVQETVDRVFSFFGFSQVWLRSWEVQAYWDGVKETSHADILLEPPTRDFGMFEFDRIDELVEIGARTASDKLESIEAAVKMTLNPESL